jgi:lysozyme
VADPQKASPKTPPKTPAVIAAAVLVAAPLATQFEGYVSKAKPDPVGIPTYCYGETENVDPTRIYSKSECAALLRARMAADYAPKLIAPTCLPQIADNRFVFGALLDASYNAGPAAVCKSRMAASIKAGDIAGACKGLIGWYTTAKDRKTGVRKQLPGLVKRRNAEAAVCATPLTVEAPKPVTPESQAPITAPPAPEPVKLSAWQRFKQWLAHLFR